MKYVVNVSGGLTSFWALKCTLDRYGKENTHPVFADTLQEEPDLYRFLRDQERYFGITLHRAVEGRDPWQVMKDEGYITMHYPGGTVAPCSRILKREIIDSEISVLYEPGTYTRVFGYEWSEIDRMDRLTASVVPDPVWFPLSEPPYVDKCYISKFLGSIGIEVPQAYADGFEHDNCGGMCVKAGQGHWAHLYFTRPERYLYAEAKEEEIRQYLGKDITILVDRRGGGTRPMTLREFRLRLEAGDTNYERDEWGGCGCFAPIAQERMEDFLLVTEVHVSRRFRRKQDEKKVKSLVGNDHVQMSLFQDVNSCKSDCSV
jgi:hypothetical protein